MIWALLTLLGVPVWLVVGALTAALLSRQRLKAQDGVIPLRIRAPGSGRWPRTMSYGRCLRGVFVVNTGAALLRTRILEVEAAREIPLDYPRKKPEDPVGRRLTLADGTSIEVAVARRAAPRLDAVTASQSGRRVPTAPSTGSTAATAAAEQDSPGVGDAQSTASARDLELLRRHEPVVRYTRGELFLPLPVEDYVGRAALFQQTGTSDAQLVPPGGLDMTTLASMGRTQYGASLSLRYVKEPLDRAAYRRWRHRPGRVPFTRASGAAAVGLLSRLIGAVIRLSLLLRGKVPGGYAAAAALQASASGPDGRRPYYGHVTCEGGYLVLQYWFLYAMNDWRSTFGGVNDHEADWEQVTVFAAEHRDGSTTPVWVASSSHDETGNDLRRRRDDPDMEWIGEHPVVYAGAGSHSGTYLKGDFLVTVPPILPDWVHDIRRAITRVIPWSRRDNAGLGIPYIDYHRGDGESVGPGQGHEWTAVLIDESTPWVRDYRGLWGLDTGDWLGGERAPAGPRYERDGRVRLSWAHPVVWAALDTEAPTADAAAALLRRRHATLLDQLATVNANIDLAREELRAARAVDQTTRRSPLSPSPDVTALQDRVSALRAEQAGLCQELDDTTAALNAWPVKEDAHAHLRRRALPLDQTPTPWARLLRVWASASSSILFAAFGLILLREQSGLLIPALVVVTAMLVIEAILRGRLVQLVLGVAAGAFAVALVAGIVALAVGNLRVGVGVLLLLTAIYMAWQTIQDALRWR